MKWLIVHFMELVEDAECPYDELFQSLGGRVKEERRTKRADRVKAAAAVSETGTASTHYGGRTFGRNTA